MRGGMVFAAGMLFGAGIAVMWLGALRPADVELRPPPAIVQAPPLPPVAIAPTAQTGRTPQSKTPDAAKTPPSGSAHASALSTAPQKPSSSVATDEKISASGRAPDISPKSGDLAPPKSPEAAPKPEDDKAAPATRSKADIRLPARAKELIIPVEGIRPDQLTDTYNDKRGGSRPHEALDIMAPKGTPVRATADGKIVKLFDSKPGGLTIYEFDTTESVVYYYAHLDRYAAGIREGMQVKQGEVIGYVGTTGNAAPNAPHLHFAVFRLGPEKHWWQGTPVNPYPLFVTQ